jgi:hypothetical protein
MKPSERARERGIEEILHYTTFRGVQGTLQRNALLSRQALDDGEFIRTIFKPVCLYRSDKPWLDHISLSVTAINTTLFSIASNKWHPRMSWWAVLAFDPSILDHDGVTFTTSNNIYPATNRGVGEQGFEALFAPTVASRRSTIIRRSPLLSPTRPTDSQAEVLYPHALGSEHLRRIYVRDIDHRHYVRSWFDVIDHREVDVQVNPGVFSASVAASV